MDKNELLDSLKFAPLYQSVLNDTISNISEIIDSYVKSKSSFHKYASIENITFYDAYIEVKVYDYGYDLYESEIIEITNEELINLIKQI